MDSPSPARCLDVDRPLLQQLVVKALQRKGMFEAEALIVAERMIDADLLGLPASGTGSVVNFTDAMDLGEIDPRARLMTVTETTAAAVIDGSTGIGHVAATRGMELAMAKAETLGAGLVLVRNSRSCGDLAPVALLASRRGMIGVALTSEPGDGEADAGELVWSCPVPQQTQVLIHRQRFAEGTTSLGLLFLILSSGLSGAEPPPRKRKASRIANAVEYSFLAIAPGVLGAADAITPRWSEVLTTAAQNASLDSARIPLTEPAAEALRTTAGKLKFAVPW